MRADGVTSFGVATGSDVYRAQPGNSGSARHRAVHEHAIREFRRIGLRSARGCTWVSPLVGLVLLGKSARAGAHAGT